MRQSHGDCKMIVQAPYNLHCLSQLVCLSYAKFLFYMFEVPSQSKNDKLYTFVTQISKSTQESREQGRRATSVLFLCTAVETAQ